MKYQLIRLAISLGLVMVIPLCGCIPGQTPSSPSTHSLNPASSINTRLKAVLEACQQQVSGWSLVKNFETAHYSLALCQQGNALHLLGQEKKLEKFIKAPAQIDRETIVAEASDRFSYEIRQGTLTVKQRGNIIVQEGIVVQEGVVLQNHTQ